MKRCPECRRDYYDETLLYCLDDGTALLDGPATAESPTAILSGDPLSDEPRTLPLAHVSRETAGQGAAASGFVGRHRVALAVTAAGFVVVAAGIGFALYKYRSAPDVPRSMKLEKLTTDGKAFNVAISPDGKHAVYSVDDGGTQSMWTRQVATSSSVPIITPAEGVEYEGIRYTPDGNFVTFLKRDRSTSIYTLYLMPTLGGSQKKLIADVDGPVSYSPDGKQFSFIRGNFPEMGESAVLIANADGTGERILAKRRRPESFPWWDMPSAVWSPDGKTIVCIIGGSSTGSGLMDVAEVNVDDGSIKPITKKGWYQIRQVAWMPDKSGLLVIGAERASDYFTQQISYLSYPDGVSRRITTDFNDYIGMSLTADGKSLSAVQSNRISNIWVVPNADASRAKQIRAGGNNHVGTDGLAWAPDGRIVFYSKASGSDDLWIMNNDGADAKQLTVDAGTNYDSAVTRDGRYVVFNSERGGQPNIWRMDLDGGNARQLTYGKNDVNPSVTPDSKWVFYDSIDLGPPGIWKVPIDGGEPVQVTQRYTANPEVSPDGKLFGCQFREDAVASWKHALFSIDGGEPLKILGLPDDGFRWSPDGRSLTYKQTSKGVANIWASPLDGGPPKQLTDFKNDLIFNFKWSPDGKSLVIARGTATADVVMIRDFR